jgi:hypothetical protein
LPPFRSRQRYFIAGVRVKTGLVLADWGMEPKRIRRVAFARFFALTNMETGLTK